MKAIAIAVVKVIGRKPTLRALRWEEHAGHTPFHRDCRVCQEAAARDRPHRKLRHPKAGALSLDIAGPLRPERDHEAKKKKKYILVGAFTWIVPKGKATEEKAVEVPDDAPTIDPDEIFADEEGGRLPGPEVNTPDQENLHPGEELRDDSGLPHGEGGLEKKDPQEEEKKEEDGGEVDEEFDIEVYRLAIPILRTGRLRKYLMR